MKTLNVIIWSHSQSQCIYTAMLILIFNLAIDKNYKELKKRMEGG